MNIEMQEVNFGEAIIYEENQSKLLVDCGAKYEGKGELAYSRVKGKIDNSTKLLITHFDEDHYNGMIHMPDTQKFKKNYLPRYYFKQGLCKTKHILSQIPNRTDETEDQPRETENIFEDFLRIQVYLISADRVSQGKTKRSKFGEQRRLKFGALHKFFLKLPKLVKTVSDIQCVSEGDSIFIDNVRATILWPMNFEKDCNIRMKTYADKVLEILRENISYGYRYDAEGSFGDFAEFVSTADKYVNTFLDIYRFYCREEERNVPDDFYENLTVLENLYQELIDFRINIMLDDRSKKRIDSILSSTIRSMNECSVVFETDNRALALGDISARIIEYLVWTHKFTYPEYQMVKVQHHGTKAYWTYSLPCAKYYLISNSGEKNCRWEIDERYGINYSDKMRCTNITEDRCSFYRKKPYKRCTNCNIGYKLRTRVRMII